MPSEPNLIDAIVRQHLTPVAQAAGFTRKGRVFRKVAGNGDAVVLGVQTSSGSRPARPKFFLNLALVPLPWLAWMRESDDPADLTDPDPSEAAVEHRLSPEPDNSWGVDIWEFGPERADEFGALAAATWSAALPDYLALLDRDEFLTRLRSGAPLPGSCQRVAVRAVLAAAAGDNDDALRAADEIARHDPESAFAAWVRRHAAGAA